MASRKKGPVLFELIRDGSRPIGPGAGPPAAEPTGGSDLLNWAGRTIRVPAGYIFVVAAVVVAAGLVGYAIGFGRAERLAEAEAARQFQQAAGVTDPLDEGPIDLELTAPAPEERPVTSGLTRERRAGATPEPPRTAGAGDADAEAEGADDGDPREPGLNYYVIARDLPGEGQRLVDWLDSRGVPAMTEPSSGGLVKIIALQGFPRGQASSAEALAFRQHLRQLGARWKRDHDGTSDFGDLYLEKYQD